MTIKVGQPAPNFSLFNHDKQLTNLQDLKGQNVLLLFFPLAFTSVCTKELCSVRDNIAFYNNSNATVLGISVDSHYCLAKYKDEQLINFSLLSDFNKKVSELYGCIYDQFGFGMRGVSKRSAFIIDKLGIVQYAEVHENASDIPNFSAIMQTLANLS